MKINLKLTTQLSAMALASLIVCSTAVAAETTGTNIKRNSPSKAKGAPDAAGMQADASFVKMAATGGMKEVEMGRMAEKQGVSPEVKKIGARMVADHNQANKELVAIAKKKGIKLDKSAPAAAMKGGSFDKDYLADMVQDHNKDIAEFMTEAKSGTDPEVKAFAQKTLPTLKGHLAMVKAAQKKVK